MLAAIGIATPDRASRKPDHDQVNEFLNRVADELYPEIARRFDPTIDDGELPGTADNVAEFQIIPSLAGDRLAQRRAARLRAQRSSARRGRRRDRGVRGVTGADASLGLRVRAAGR